jgi:hypothetical protein
VVVPDALLDLIERLPENTRVARARRRLTEGLTYGPSRDDAAMTHP